MSFSESWLPNWNFCLVYDAGLSEPLPHYYTVYSADPIEAALSTFSTNIILAITIYVVLSFYASTFIKSTFQPRIFCWILTQKCATPLFILIIPNLDVRMRPRPAANPHQQEKKTRKYYIYVMFQFAGNIIKNDAKITDLFPHRDFLLRVERVAVHRLLPKTAKNVVLLITSDAPTTTGITCVSMATFVRA